MNGEAGRRRPALKDDTERLQPWSAAPDGGATQAMSLLDRDAQKPKRGFPVTSFPVPSFHLGTLQVALEHRSPMMNWPLLLSFFTFSTVSFSKQVWSSGVL